MPFEMNGLLPIVRRKRRPLLEADASPVVVGNRDAVAANEALENIQPPTPNLEPPVTDGKASDAKITSKRNAR